MNDTLELIPTLHILFGDADLGYFEVKEEWNGLLKAVRKDGEALIFSQCGDLLSPSFIGAKPYLGALHQASPEILSSFMTMEETFKKQRAEQEQAEQTRKRDQLASNPPTWTMSEQESRLISKCILESMTAHHTGPYKLTQVTDHDQLHQLNSAFWAGYEYHAQSLGSETAANVEAKLEIQDKLLSLERLSRDLTRVKEDLQKICSRGNLVAGSYMDDELGDLVKEVHKASLICKEKSQAFDEVCLKGIELTKSTNYRVSAKVPSTAAEILLHEIYLLRKNYEERCCNVSENDTMQL